MGLRSLSEENGSDALALQDRLAKMAKEEEKREEARAAELAFLAKAVGDVATAATAAASMGGQGPAAAKRRSSAAVVVTEGKKRDLSATTRRRTKRTKPSECVARPRHQLRRRERLERFLPPRPATEQPEGETICISRLRARMRALEEDQLF